MQNMWRKSSAFDRVGRAIKNKYTRTQGQYLAFIYYYTKLNRIPPSEMDMQRYFRTTPPAVHQMVLKLEEKGFIAGRRERRALFECCSRVNNCLAWSKLK